MDNSSHYDGVMALGRRLVVELGLEQSTDTLARWMAHYIAELISRAESASGDERSEKRAQCADAILSLWKHFHELPNGRRPFEGVEPVLDALKTLNPDDPTPRYFRTARKPLEGRTSASTSDKWLTIADEVDAAAKTLIRHALIQAASSEVDKAKEWLDLAEKIGVDDDLMIPLVRFVIAGEKSPEGSTEADALRERLEKRLQRLLDFQRVLSIVATDLRHDIELLKQGK